MLYCTYEYIYIVFAVLSVCEGVLFIVNYHSLLLLRRKTLLSLFFQFLPLTIAISLSFYHSILHPNCNFNFNCYSNSNNDLYFSTNSYFYLSSTFNNAMKGRT